MRFRDWSSDVCSSDLLLIHGEVTDAAVDIFDREAVFIDRALTGLVRDFPELRIVLEHITTAEAAAFVTDAGPRVAATITPQHLHINRNALFAGGLRPHAYRSEEHTSEIQSQMRISYAVFCLKK